MAGICSYGGYVPRYRLNRGTIVQAMAWMNMAIMAHMAGEKAVANYDEDPITMGVAAGLDALKGIDRRKVEGVYFASTTMPYRERLNAGIIIPALNVNDQVRAADFGGGLKAGTTALLAALEGVESGRINNIVVTSADCRLALAATNQEMIFGDAAAAFVVGTENVIAEFKDSYSVTYDFADHMRANDSDVDRQWEERWIRDMGYAQFIPEAITGLLEKCGLKITDFAKVIYPCNNRGARKDINKKLVIPPEIEQSNLQTEIGDSGTSLPLVMLAQALETAQPGDKLLVASYGSGVDALYFEVTENINGTKLFIHDAHCADQILVVAKTKVWSSSEEGISIFLVDPKIPGITITPLETIADDHQSEIVFENVVVPSANMIGEEGQAWPIMKRILQEAAIAKCAEMIGGCDWTVETSSAYAKERVQYGHPIGAYGSIQHYLADMWIEAGMARRMTYFAAWHLDQGTSCNAEIAKTKACVNEAYKHCTRMGIQVHGGIGTTHDHDIGLFYRRSRQAALLFGDTEDSLNKVAEEMGL